MHTLSGTLHNAWKKLRTDMTAPAHADLAFWSVVFIFFIYAASVPLATETQSTLAWTLEIGRAHDRTPVTNHLIVCRLLL